MSSRFEGLSVLITGAAGGFGRRAAERFAEGGARLVLSDRNAEGLASLAATLPADTVTLPGDITDEAMHRRLGYAMSCDRVDGLTQWAKWRFVSPRKIELGFGRGQRINRKLALHERK